MTPIVKRITSGLHDLALIAICPLAPAAGGLAVPLGTGDGPLRPNGMVTGPTFVWPGDACCVLLALVGFSSTLLRRKAS
jgi:hypothetical protein